MTQVSLAGFFNPYLFIYLFIHLFIYLFICLFVNQLSLGSTEVCYKSDMLLIEAKKLEQ